MIKPIDLEILIKTPVSELQKHIAKQFYNTNGYILEVVINNSKLLYSPCGMFVFLYNEDTEIIYQMFELGAFN